MLKSELQETKKLLEAEKSQKEELQVALTEAKKKIQEQDLSQDKIKELEGQCETQMKELSQLTKEYSNARSSREKLEFNLAHAQKKLADLELSHQTLSLELINSKANTTVLEDQCKTQKEELAQMSADLCQAKTSLGNLELVLIREKKRNTDSEIKHQAKILELSKDRNCEERLEEPSALDETRLDSDINKKLELDLSEAKKNIIDLNAERQKLISELEEYKAKVAEQIMKCRTHNAQLNNSRVANRKIESDLAEEKTKFYSLDVENQRLNSELNKSLTKVNELSKMLVNSKCAQTVKKNLELDFSEAKKNFKDLNVQHQALIPELEKNKARVAELENETKTLKARLWKVLDAYKPVKDAKEKLELDLSEAKKNFEDLNVHHLALTSDLEKYKARVAEHNREGKMQSALFQRAVEAYKGAKDAKEKLELDLSEEIAKVQDLNVQHQAMTSELEKYKARVAELENETNTQKTRLWKALDAYKPVKDAKEKLELDLSEEKAKVQNLEVHHQALTSELEMYKARLAELDIESNTQKAQLCKAFEVNKCANDAKEKLELDLSEEKTKSQDLDAQNQALISGLEVHKARAAKQDIQCEMQKKELTEHLKANFVNKNLNIILQKKVSDLEMTTESQNLTISNINAELASKDRLNRSLKDQNSELQKQLGSKDSELSVEKNQTAVMKRVIDVLNSKVESLKLEKDQLTTKLDEANTGTQTENKRLEEVTKLLEEKDRQLEELNRTVEELNRSSKFLKTELIKMENEKEDLQEKVEKLQGEASQQLLEHKTEKAKLNRKIEQLEEDNDNLITQAEDNNKQTIAKHNQEKADYEAKLEALRQSLEVEQAKNKTSDVTSLVDEKKKVTELPRQGFETRPTEDDDDDDVVILDRKDDLKILQERISSQDDRIVWLQKKLNFAQNALAIKANEVTHLKSQLETK